VTATDRAVELVTLAAAAAADKLATDIIAYDVSEQLVITDVFLLCSASNDRQVKSIVDEIEDRLRKAGAKPVRREGEREGRWVLLDYLDVVIHVQHAEERVFYSLERLWKDCPVIPLAEPVTAGRAAGAGVGGVGGAGAGGARNGGARNGGATAASAGAGRRAPR
jgi:ribosome-associated protein